MTKQKNTKNAKEKPQGNAAKHSGGAGKRTSNSSKAVTTPPKNPAKRREEKEKQNAIQRLIAWLKAFITKKDKVVKKKKKRRKKQGFAYTKKYPHENHPARYIRKQRDSDDIEYITLTHHGKVTLPNGKVIDTIPLTSNINPKERGTFKPNGEPNISYVFPYVYEGKRSALYEETDEFSLTNEDSKIIEELFKILPKKKVTHTNNSKKKRNT